MRGFGVRMQAAHPNVVQAFPLNVARTAEDLAGHREVAEDDAVEDDDRDEVWTSAPSSSWRISIECCLFSH